jgi:hypothetical protein
MERPLRLDNAQRPPNGGSCDGGWRRDTSFAPVDAAKIGLWLTTLNVSGSGARTTHLIGGKPCMGSSNGTAAASVSSSRSGAITTPAVRSTRRLEHEQRRFLIRASNSNREGQRRPIRHRHGRNRPPARDADSAARGVLEPTGPDPAQRTGNALIPGGAVNPLTPSLMRAPGSHEECPGSLEDWLCRPPWHRQAACRGDERSDRSMHPVSKPVGTIAGTRTCVHRAIPATDAYRTGGTSASRSGSPSS